MEFHFAYYVVFILSLDCGAAYPGGEEGFSDFWAFKSTKCGDKMVSGDPFLLFTDEGLSFFKEGRRDEGRKPDLTIKYTDISNIKNEGTTVKFNSGSSKTVMEMYHWIPAGTFTRQLQQRIGGGSSMGGPGMGGPGMGGPGMGFPGIGGPGMGFPGMGGPGMGGPGMGGPGMGGPGMGFPGMGGPGMGGPGMGFSGMGGSGMGSKHKNKSHKKNKSGKSQSKGSKEDGPKEHKSKNKSKK